MSKKENMENITETTATTAADVKTAEKQQTAKTSKPTSKKTTGTTAKASAKITDGTSVKTAAKKSGGTTAQKSTKTTSAVKKDEDDIKDTAGIKKQKTEETQPAVIAEPTLETAIAEELTVTEQITDDNVEQQVHYKQLSPALMVARRFFRSRLSLVGLVMLIVLFLFAFLGPVFMKWGGYKWGEIDPDYSPTWRRAGEWVEYIDAKGEKHSVYQYNDRLVDFNQYASPDGNHWLGTDEKGMDVFIRLMYGGRVSLTLGFVVVILETLLGVLMGGLAGYFGGWVDQVIMRVVDVLNCIPTLPILLIASAVLESWEVDPQFNIYYLMIILTVFGWSGIARMVRGQILYLREQEYIVACEVMGTPTWRRIFKHLVPNIMPQLIVSMTLGLGSVILYESTLSYLGLGVPIPYAAWGTMISASTNPITMQNYPNLWIPAGILIVIAVLGFNFVGDGLRDAMDPKMKR